MNVIAHGPYRVSSLSWRPRPGAWSLAVVCRAGFELAPGESPLVTLPKSAPGEERRILEQAVTQAPCKRWPEVLVVGHAYAPEGKPVTSLSARLAVGAVDKMVRVIGDRRITTAGETVGPAPFARMPLRWERAAGGPETGNPVGVVVGAGARADGWGHVSLPNLEPMGASSAMRRDLVPPVGFGMIASRWPTRVARLHRHAAAWDPVTWGERPLPGDFDFAYFNVAPDDQALSELTGDEHIVLENLHPRHARLSTRLRVVAPRAVAGIDGVSRELALRCDTLVLDTDHGLAQIVWRGQVTLDHPVGEWVVIVESAAPLPPMTVGAPTVVLPGPSTPLSAAGATAGHDLEVATIAAPLAPLKPALPFQVPSQPQTVSETETLVPFHQPKPALPFVEQVSAVPRAVAAAPAPEGPLQVPVAPALWIPPPLARAESEPPPPDLVGNAVPAPAPAAPPSIAPAAPPSIAPAAPPSSAGAHPPSTAPGVTGLRAVILARLTSGGSLHDLELSGVALDGLDFTGVALERRSFAASSLTGCNFTGARLAGADLSGADLTGATFARASLPGADLTRANVERARFDRAILTRANLSSTRGTSACFAGATMVGADLRQANLPEAVFDRATLEGALANKADFTRASFVRANLAGANLRAAKLRGATLAGAQIDGADLREANLSGANVHGVTLASATTGGAILRDLVEIAPPDDGEAPAGASY